MTQTLSLLYEPSHVHILVGTARLTTIGSFHAAERKQLGCSCAQLPQLRSADRSLMRLAELPMMPSSRVSCQRLGDYSGDFGCDGHTPTG